MLHALMSVLTHSDHVFIDIPCPLELGMAILMTKLIPVVQVACKTWPYYLKHLVHKDPITSCILRFAYSAAWELFVEFDAAHPSDPGLALSSQ